MGFPVEMSEVVSKLCWKDPRNPDFDSYYGTDDHVPPPRINCFCDNCFYGRDKLAMEILRLRGEKNGDSE